MINVDSDNGSSNTSAFKVLSTEGVCHESEWPYDRQELYQKPQQSCYTDALKTEYASAQVGQTLEEMQTCLATGNPFVFGVETYQSFESETRTDRSYSHAWT